MKKDLLLIGGGGHCRAVIDVIERTGRWRIAGIVERAAAPGTTILGYPVIGADDELPALHADIGHALVTIGQIKSAATRMRLYRQLKDIGYRLATIISPRAEVSRHADIGEGTVVMHMAAIGPASSIGVNGIINSRALIEHDCQVGPHCHISTAATLNGGVHVGEGSFIGSGSVLRQGLAVGAGCVIGMGCDLRKSLPDNTLFTG